MNISKEKTRSQEELLFEIERLRTRLAESEETLHAIQSGEVDALVVFGEQGKKVLSLKSAEQPYHILIKEMKEGAILLADDGTILYCNRGFAGVLKIPPEKVMGGKIQEFITPADRAVFEELLGKGREGGSKGEITFSAGDGAPVAMYLSIGTSRMDEGTVICLVAMDLTERKRAEKALMDSEEKYRALMDDASDAILLADVHGNLLEANKKAEELLGCTKKELLNAHIIQIHPNEELGRAIAAFKETVRRGSGSLIDGSVLRKDGRAVPVDITASFIKYAGRSVVQEILRDTTERRRAEEALKSSEEKYKNLVELATDMIYTSDIDGNVTYMNGAGYRVLEAAPEDVIDKPWVDWIHLEDREVSFGKSTGTDVFDYENRLVSKSGKVINVLHNVRVLRNEKGEIIGTQGIARDITERKRAEEVRLENERLLYTNQVKSEFLASVSHDIRTPLNSIIGFSELMKQRTAGELNQKQKRYVNNVIESSKFLLELINNILDLSKIEAGRMEITIEKLNVPQVVDETINLIKERAMKQNVILKKEIDPRLEFIEADKQRIKQILFNLIGNAVKFSKEEGGTVTITAKMEGDMAMFSVSDTGIGIEEKNLGKLFRKFQQADPEVSKKYGGTGLGLAISKQLVELHGGKIWAESKYGEGSVFIFLIPLVASAKNEQVKRKA